MNSPLISVNTWLNPLLTLRTMSGSGTEGLGTSLCLRAPYTRMILERKPWPPAEGGSAMERLCGVVPATNPISGRSEEHTSELQTLMRISYAVFCLQKKTNNHTSTKNHNETTLMIT